MQRTSENIDNYEALSRIPSSVFGKMNVWTRGQVVGDLAGICILNYTGLYFKRLKHEAIVTRGQLYGMVRNRNETDKS